MLGVSRPSSQPKAQPEKGWRNYYRVHRVIRFLAQGTVFPGVMAGPRVFESKEIAERHAANWLAGLNPPGRHIVDHAGAFPEGDRAN